MGGCLNGIKYRAALHNGYSVGQVPDKMPGRTSGSASFKFDEREVKMPKIAVAGVKEVPAGSFSTF